MKKGFFISIDLIITLATVVLLIGLLGAYMHDHIQNYAEYKDNVKMQATMNIVLNRLADSQQCYLVDDFTIKNKIKPLSFCLSFFDIFDDLDYNISIYNLNSNNYIYNEFDKSKTNYIAKDINIFYSSQVKKSDYIKCFNSGDCIDAGKIAVRIYVWR